MTDEKVVNKGRGGVRFPSGGRKVLFEGEGTLVRLAGIRLTARQVEWVLSKGKRSDVIRGLIDAAMRAEG